MEATGSPTKCETNYQSRRLHFRWLILLHVLVYCVETPGNTNSKKLTTLRFLFCCLPFTRDKCIDCHLERFFLQTIQSVLLVFICLNICTGSFIRTISYFWRTCLGYLILIYVTHSHPKLTSYRTNNARKTCSCCFPPCSSCSTWCTAHVRPWVER